MESIFIKDQDEIWFHLLSLLTPNALHTDAIYSFYSTPHTVAGLGPLHGKMNWPKMMKQNQKSRRRENMVPEATPKAKAEVELTKKWSNIDPFSWKSADHMCKKTLIQYVKWFCKTLRCLVSIYFTTLTMRFNLGWDPSEICFLWSVRLFLFLGLQDCPGEKLWRY